MTHEHGIKYAVCVELKVVLFEHRETLTRTEFYRTLVWLQIATDSAE